MLPVLAPPVRRPEVVQPHQSLDLEFGTIAEIVAAHMALTYGANDNDPGPWNAITFYERRGSR